MTYLDKILYLHPDASGVVYWQTRYDGTPWDDLYDGLVFDNPNFEIPTKEVLDSLDENLVAEILDQRKNVLRKVSRDFDLGSSLIIRSGLKEARKTRPTLDLTTYLDELEEMEV